MPLPPDPALPPGEVGEAPVLFGPGTVPVTGFVGAEVAGEATGEVTAGCPAVVPLSAHAARPKRTPATGTMSESLLIMLILTSFLGSRKLREARGYPVNAGMEAQLRDDSASRTRHPETSGMRRIVGLGGLCEEADAFLLDQFGTLHDGVRLYPGVAAAMAALRMAGKRLIILSNSGKRSALNMERLTAIGLPPESYDGFLSSGEVAWRLLAERRLPALADARRCLVLARGSAKEALTGLDLEPVEDAGEADLILLLGSEADRIGLDTYRERLAAAARRGVTCLCGNPDRTMVLGDGRLAPASGRLAELYAELGGPVIWIGKPGAAIYAAAFDMLRSMIGSAIDPSRIWAVGDSVEHDVAGAAAQGCRSVLVMTGIMAGRSEAYLAEEVTRFGAAPDATMVAFA